MNFYYDPILGLKYDGDLNTFLIIDISVIPKDIDLEEFIKKWLHNSSVFGIYYQGVQQICLQEITEYPT